jgi:hypothetical protein
MLYCVTGPRIVTIKQQAIIIQIITKEFNPPENVVVNVGDATGVDDLIHNFAKTKGLTNKLFVVLNRYNKFSYAKRSMRMVDATLGGTLLAFPNKKCPEKVKPNNAFCGSGSGTWGTIAYAKLKNLDIKIFPLAKISLPSWLK